MQIKTFTSDISCVCKDKSNSTCVDEQTLFVNRTEGGLITASETPLQMSCRT